MRQNRHFQIFWLMCNWVGGCGLDIGAHNFKFLDTDWIWSLWKNFASNPIAKFPYQYTTVANQWLEVTRLWLNSTRSWLDSDLTRKNLRCLYFDKNGSGTSLLLTVNILKTLKSELLSSCEPMIEHKLTWFTFPTIYLSLNLWVGFHMGIAAIIMHRPEPTKERVEP